MTDISTSLIAELSRLLVRPVPMAARERARRHLLDWLGCAIGARPTLQGAALARWSATGFKRECTALLGPPSDRLRAVMINGALGNVLEMDDVHRSSILHPGPVVIPAALAMAEVEGLSLARLLDAIVRGYEAMIRIGRSFGRAHYRYFHNTSSAGAFGAAAAAAAVLGLPAVGLSHALALAGTRTGGLWQMRLEPGEAKSWHNAQAAQSGLQAAEWAAAGYRGPLAILEGPLGLYAAMAADADPAQVLAMDSIDWQIEGVSFKPWPACRHAHPVIDAALRLVATAPLDVAAIDKISIASYQDALRFCDRAEPVDEAQARFSLQHAVAVCLRRGAPRAEDFRGEALHDPALAALRARCRLSADAALEARYPQHYGAQLSIQLADGSVRECLIADAWGDPEWPLSVADIAGKAQRLLQAGGVSGPMAQRLAEAILEWPEDTPVHALGNLLQAALSGPPDGRH